MESIKKYFGDSQQTFEQLCNDSCQLKNIQKATKVMIRRLDKKNKILLCGNGGSAADSQHIAAELVSKFNYKRKALSAIALTTDTSILTSISNDFSFKYIFSRQIEALGRKGDVLLAYSTSGNSENILEAIKQAKKQNMIIVGLTGSKKGKMNKNCDILIEAPSQFTPKIQECHLAIGHYFCDVIEKKFKT